MTAAVDTNLELVPSARVWLGGHAEAVRRRLTELLPALEKPATGPVDALLVTPRDADEWAYFLGKHRHRLTPDGRAWLVGEDPPAWTDDDARHAAARCGMAFVRRVQPAPGLLADGFAPQPAG